MSRLGSPNQRRRGGPRALALSVLEHATREMRGTGSRSATTPHYHRDRRGLRIKAILFLGSKQAGVWFDVCGLDQSYTLARMGWPQHAKELLDKGTPLDEEKAGVLKLGLDAIGLTR
jgi:hypothetical protein